MATQPGEDNYELALDYCLHSLEHHRYGDASPSQVDELLDRCKLACRMPVRKAELEDSLSFAMQDVAC